MNNFQYIKLLFCFLTITSFSVSAQKQNVDSVMKDFSLSYLKFDSLYSFHSQGDDIFYRKWGNYCIPGDHKVLLVIHGLGYHCSPFKKITNYIENGCILVYAIDLRGHGLSGKIKGDIESNEKIITDIGNMIQIIEHENPGSDIYIMGSSMGGTYTMGYLLSHKNENELAGAILVGPSVKLHKSQIFQIESLKIVWLSLFDHSKSAINIDGKKIKMSTDNQEWINARKSDPLAIHYINAHYLKHIHQMQKTIKNKSELESISTPILILHGGKDKVCDLKGSYYLKENLSRAPTDLLIYPESYHSLFWDKDSNLILNDIVHWITKQ